MAINNFKWIDFYTKFANELLEYKDNRIVLIGKIQNAYKDINMSLPTLERDGNLTDIDPFTVFGLFNRGIKNSNRKKIIEQLIKEFNISAAIPDDFSGIPVLMPMSSTFYAFRGTRKENDIDNLWDVFVGAITLDENDNQQNRDNFSTAYDKVLTQYGVKWNLTMGLYWIRPYKYLNLDSRNRWYMSIPDNMPADIVIEISKIKDVPAAYDYLQLCNRCIDALDAGKYAYKSFPELSYYAWITSEDVNNSKKQQKYEMTITADKISSTDYRFTMNDLNLGDKYKPLDVYFKSGDGNIIRRSYAKGERKNSNQTLPRLVFQIYEQQISGLSVEERESFPVCQYSSDKEVIRGIFFSIDDYRKKFGPTWEYVSYSYGDGRMFVIYSWNLFSTLIFVQECLKRFGKAGDEFVLIYRDKGEQPIEQGKIDPVVPEFKGYRNQYSSALIESKNIIFHGAPGTGKSYLAKEIAADIVSDGYEDDYEKLTSEQKQQVEFVQLHPSYDYTDFVEGLRPKVNDGRMVFELQDGIFKRFVDRARKNYEDFQKSEDELKKYIFIIDEINRGEISKIFGELFFSIDPGYRGRKGEVSTQYASMHTDPDEKFYIPENVYIIGTMNDIDRSVDSFDFAMRRRFRFIKLNADDQLEMLSSLDDEKLKNEAIRRLEALNSEIAKTEDLNENYQIGAAYFLKLKTLSFDQLWTDYIEPLLEEYIQGMYNEDAIMQRFATAYGYKPISERNDDETASNQ